MSDIIPYDQDSSALDSNVLLNSVHKIRTADSEGALRDAIESMSTNLGILLMQSDESN